MVPKGIIVGGSSLLWTMWRSYECLIGTPKTGLEICGIICMTINKLPWCHTTGNCDFRCFRQATVV